MNTSGLPGRAYDIGSVNVKQGALGHVEKQFDRTPKWGLYVAKVVKVYPDRVTCDIEVSTELSPNVPLQAKVGIDPNTNEIWGEIEYPAIGSYVVVQPLDKFNKKKMIIGAFVPYLMPAYSNSQIPIKSTKKAFSLKLLNASDTTAVYRKIFQSGASLEVTADGTYVFETPSGSYLLIDEANQIFTIKHKKNTDSVDFKLQAGVGFTVEDSTGNSVVSTTSGLSITDKNNNTISMVAGKVTINSNLEIAQ